MSEAGALRLNAGLHVIPAAVYHADPCPQPSLSSSVARTLLAYSPEHARYQHPRLNPDYAPGESEIFDLGTAAHAYLLEGEMGFEIIDAADWRTKAAREARDAARLLGKTPILAHRWDGVKAMVDLIMERLSDFEGEPRPFTKGQPEQTLIWQDGGVWCRARLDWLHSDHRTVDDLKTVSGSANPETWGRSLWGMGYDVQAAFYLRGVKAVFGTDAQFRFVVAEHEPPYALSVCALDPAGLELADRKVRRAINLWRACLEDGHWPGYATHTCTIDLPPWEEAKVMEQEMRDTK